MMLSTSTYAIFKPVGLVCAASDFASTFGADWLQPVIETVAIAATAIVLRMFFLFIFFIVFLILIVVQ